MDGFPYLIVLFLFTMVAIILYAAKTRRAADKAFHDNTPSTARMAAPRSPAGRVMQAAIDERRAALSSGGTSGST